MQNKKNKKMICKWGKICSFNFTCQHAEIHIKIDRCDHLITEGMPCPLCKEIKDEN